MPNRQSKGESHGAAKSSRQSSSLLAGMFSLFASLVSICNIYRGQMCISRDPRVSAFFATMNQFPTLSIQKQISTEVQELHRHKTANLNQHAVMENQKAVIATKIHGIHQWKLLEQSQCLFHHAYNNQSHTLYDVVVFTTEAVPQANIESLRNLLSSSKKDHGKERINVQVVVDNRGSLAEEIAALPSDKKSVFLQQCTKAQLSHKQSLNSNMTKDILQNLTWFSDCGNGRLAYNWQSEFRSKRLWTHPALSQYRYMLWIDADVFATRRILEIEHDPINIAIRNNLVLLFGQFPNGGSRNLGERISNSFLFYEEDDNEGNSVVGVTNGDGNTRDHSGSLGRKKRLCRLRLTEEGTLQSTFQEIDDTTYDRKKCDWNNTLIQGVNGYFHVTDLDFYRQPKVLDGIDALFGDCFLCRFPDDQLAVTLPAALYAPARSWDLSKAANTSMSLFHNHKIDGKEKVGMGFKQLWRLKRLRQAMRGARGVCPVTEKS